MKKDVEGLRLAGKQKSPSRVDVSLCSYPSCKVCVLDYGCPSLSVGEDRVSIDPLSCAGCRVCVQVCPRGAIALPHEDADRIEG